MKNWFYFLVYFFGYPPMVLASSTIVLHRDRARRAGAYILASNHMSFYDPACLIKETPRILHFLSVVEAFRHPLAGWFMRHIGALPLDRAKHDAHTLRQVLDHLAQGHVLAIFPEATIRTEENSVFNGGRMKPGVGRIAGMANVPIVPCVLIGARGFQVFKKWLPLRRIKIGLIYGEAFTVAPDEDPQAFEERLRKMYIALHEELKGAMGARFGESHQASGASKK